MILTFPSIRGVITNFIVFLFFFKRLFLMSRGTNALKKNIHTTKIM